ncbi:hypothetical protein ACIREM_44075 [Streptomyces shenzhenensis]
MPALIALPSSPDFFEMVTALVTAVVWAVMAWRNSRLGHPRP